MEEDGSDTACTDYSDNRDFEFSSYGIDSDTDSDSESDHENISNSEPIPPLQSSPSPITQPSTSREDNSHIESSPSTSSGIRQWSNIRQPAVSIPLSDTSGLKIDMPGNRTIDFFDAIANDGFYNLIINESNQYSVEVLASSEGDKSRITSWKDITLAEFRQWLGLLFNVGTIRLN